MSEGRFLLLQPDWQLRGYRDGLSMAFHCRTGEKHFLSEGELAAARMCDGRQDFSAPHISPEARRVAVRLVADGIARPAREGEPLLPGQAFRRAANRYIDGLLLSVTNRCNFRCRHCFVEAPAGKYGELGREQLFSLLDQFEAANVCEVALTGGEPFLRPELPEFLCEMQKKRILFTEVFTNAALLDDRLLDAVEGAGYRPYFKVSFDCAGSHDYMRGVKGAEEATLRGIRLLRSRGFSVTVITSIDKVVAQGLPETLELLAGLGVDNWWMAPPMEVGAWRGTDSSIALDELIPALKDVLRKWNAMGRPFDMILWRLGRYHKKGRIFQGMGEAYGDDSFNCKPMHMLPYVTPDGTLVPCGSFTGTAVARNLPNLMQTLLDEAWDAPEMRALCDLRKGAVRAYNPACRACEFFAQCGSGCRVAALLTRGDLMASDPVSCRLYRGGYMADFHAFAESLDGENA